VADRTFENSDALIDAKSAMTLKERIAENSDPNQGCQMVYISNQIFQFG
jgi:hypothetical protein